MVRGNILGNCGDGRHLRLRLLEETISTLGSRSTHWLAVNDEGYPVWHLLLDSSKGIFNTLPICRTLWIVPL